MGANTMVQLTSSVYVSSVKMAAIKIQKHCILWQAVVLDKADVRKMRPRISRIILYEVF